MQSNKFKVLLVILILLFSSEAWAQVGGRTDLGLEGCPIQAITSSTDASVVLAACESPFGLHYSTDGGQSWQYADGGSYESGSVRSVTATSNGFYASTDSGVLKASAPVGGSWSADWSSISSLSSSVTQASIYSLGDFLYVGSGNAIFVLNTADDSLAQTVETPNDENFQYLAVAPQFVYLLTQEGSTRKFYRATRNLSTGLIGNAWTDLSENSAFPDGGFFWSVFAHGSNGTVYVGVRELGVDISDLMYVSSDNGTNFTSTEEATVANSMCFSGDTHIMGTRVSTDAGASFIDLAQDQLNSDLNGTGRREDQGCWIDPTNAEVALFTTNDGIDRTADLSSSNRTIISASLGLTGTLVYSISRSTDNADRAVFGTSAGVAFTNSFTSDEPEFIFPICPGNDCVGRGNVVLDPDDDSFIYYVSGNIRKGTISTSGSDTSVSWVDFANKPNDFFNVTVVETTPLLPGKLIVGYSREEGEINGGLYIYDTTTASETHSEDLDGLQINSFIAVSTQVMFVSTRGQDRGIYRSRDAGTSWERMTDDDLGSDILISVFAYDSVRDVLYAAKEDQSELGNGTVLSLKKASSKGRDWKAPKSGFLLEDESSAQVSFTSLAVDEGASTVYAGSSAQIWHSMDDGQNWTLFFEGAEGEETQELSVGRGDSLNSEGDVRINASIWSSLVQAASSGLFELQENTPEGTTCRVKVPRNCKGQLSKASKCKLQVSIRNSITKEDMEGSFRLYKRKNAKQNWQPFGKVLSTNSKGKKAKALKVKRSTQYQARFFDLFCQSNAGKIRIKK